ncbi:MAG: hypothetical protein ACFB51_00350 [Anaerolineae bacterium]
MSNYVGEPNPRTMFLEGPFGAGKTTFAVETLFAWLEADIPPEQIVITVPQRTLARRYILALRSVDRPASGDVSIRTLNGLAQDMVDIYWPVVAPEYGFSDPELAPRYQTIETAQYVIGRFVDDAVERGEFEAIKATPQVFARQIIDNMGKAALMDVPYTAIPELLTQAWGPQRARKRVLAYQTAGQIAEQYRTYCLKNRLLDYALQIELFVDLLKKPPIRERFYGQYSYIIADHVEEEAALMHDLLVEWTNRAEGMLGVADWDGGFRVFLGAAPEGIDRLREACDGVMTMGDSLIPEPALKALQQEIAHGIKPEAVEPVETDELGYSFAFHNFYPQMLDWVADKIAWLVDEEGVPPREIAVLAPFLSDALLFSLTYKIEKRGVLTLSHRPSRALRDEPAARTLLTLTALAHPHWGQMPPQPDVADALAQAIGDLDPVRAQLLTKIVYRPNSDPPLTSFDNIKPEMQARITYRAGQLYDDLRFWLLEDYPQRYEGQTAPLDHFFSLLFGEVLSQAGYGFHNSATAGRVTAELVESARKFRQSLYSEGASLDAIGNRYFDIVRQGLLSALYVASWRDELADAVFIAPAYTFLLRNRPVDVQFWLDVGSTGWWERLDQPLTHPYVLSRTWPQERIWQDSDEVEHQRDMLWKITQGLVRRARRHIYLGISDLGEQGFEQRGPLLTVFQGILGRHPQTPDVDNTDHE